jgi:hypothetical protein
MTDEQIRMSLNRRERVENLRKRTQLELQESQKLLEQASP